MALDAHDRQDNDGGGLVGSIRTPEAYDAPIVGKLDNVAHVGGPAICPLLPGSGPPKRGASTTSSQVSGMQG
jgi:hypothetical protein